MTTPRLLLSELVANQSQPHAPVNASLRELDALVQAVVLDFISSLPGSPADGDVYILTVNAGGGLKDDIAYYSGGWKFVTPRSGWRVYVITEDSDFRFGAGSPSSWVSIADGGGGGTTLTVSAVGSPSAIVSDVTQIVFNGSVEIESGGAGVANVFVGGSDGSGGSSSSVVEYQLAASDMATTITTGTGKAYFRAPRAFTCTSVRASLFVASNDSGSPTSLVTVDVNLNGSTMLGANKLVFDNSEKTTKTAAQPVSFSGQNIADDDEISVDIDVAGVGAKGLMVTLIGTI